MGKYKRRKNSEKMAWWMMAKEKEQIFEGNAKDQGRTRCGIKYRDSFKPQDRRCVQPPPSRAVGKITNIAM